ncbi:MAG: GNAT family N-acetyltransferase [Bacteroidetes bacterium]|nr:GNAT family N-acetyltransferase [Bacteroidota bacterium]
MTTNKNPNLQPTTLENEFVKLVPLQAGDFERLYKVASDPLIWEQHPNRDRYKRDVFLTFFNGALESGGAFLVIDPQTHEVIGSSRYYNFDANSHTVVVGYTFLARSYWGGKYNKALKSLMLNYAFTFAESVELHVGSNNIRSQTAVMRLGAHKIREQEVTYYGELPKLNFIYRINKADWKG